MYRTCNTAITATLFLFIALNFKSLRVYAMILYTDIDQSVMPSYLLRNMSNLHNLLAAYILV